MPCDDDYLWPHLVDLKECLCEALAGCESVCACEIIPGPEPTIDYCDPGYAWIRVVSENRVVPQTRRQQCFDDDPWIVTLEMGVARCEPQPSSNGTPPSTEAREEAARRMLADKKLMKRAALCCWKPKDRLGDDVPVFVSFWNPSALTGACVNGTLTVQMFFPATEGL